VSQGWRDSSHTAMVGAGKFGSAKLPMATVMCPGKPSFSQVSRGAEYRTKMMVSLSFPLSAVRVHAVVLPAKETAQAESGLGPPSLPAPQTRRAPPRPAGRQPRMMATASTIANDSTASTNEARNAAVTADPRCKLLLTGASDMRFWVVSQFEFAAKILP
jgi:hypothetical protein